MARRGRVVIAVDWGTSSLRAWRLDASGRILDERHADAPLLASQGRFEAVLASHLEGWSDELVLMCGMVGSRNGWREVPYVDAPAGIELIAGGVVAIEAPSLAPRRVCVVPGVRSTGDVPEVMRGEETQLVGLLGALGGPGPHTVCLPGTHSKWASIEEARIVRWRTAMTGELFALLRRHSLLAALMPRDPAGDADDLDAFERGVRASADAAPLACRLFGVRTRGLFGALSDEAAPSFLSGLLIGDELRGLMAGADAAAIGPVHLVGQSALVARYARALALLGLDARAHDPTLAAHGLFRLAEVSQR